MCESSPPAVNSVVDALDHISTSVIADVYKPLFDTRVNVGSEDIISSYITVELCELLKM